jgi:hypothetical protein
MAERHGGGHHLSSEPALRDPAQAMMRHALFGKSMGRPHFRGAFRMPDPADGIWEYRDDDPAALPACFR